MSGFFLINKDSPLLEFAQQVQPGRDLTPGAGYFVFSGSHASYNFPNDSTVTDYSDWGIAEDDERTMIDVMMSLVPLLESGEMGVIQLNTQQMKAAQNSTQWAEANEAADTAS